MAGHIVGRVVDVDVDVDVGVGVGVVVGLRNVRRKFVVDPFRQRDKMVASSEGRTVGRDPESIDFGQQDKRNNNDGQRIVIGWWRCGWPRGGYRPERIWFHSLRWFSG